MRRVLPLLIGPLLIGAVLLRAQAPPDTTAYSVAYFDTAQASRSAAIDAVRQYRDGSRKDDGFRRIEFFEQGTRAAHFCVIETWAGLKDLDAHAASAHTKDFRAKIDAIRVSDYDQRPYKTLSLGDAHHDGNGRGIFVITHVDIGGPGNAADLLRRLAEDSRKEEGNLRFDVLQHTMRANHFTVIEEWQTAKALENHVTAAHTKEYRNSLAPMAGSPLDERLYKAVE